MRECWVDAHSDSLYLYLGKIRSFTGAILRQSTVAIVWALVLGVQLGAQQIRPTNGGLTSSLGQPNAWKWTAGGGAGLERRDDIVRGTVSAHLGLLIDLMNPVLGAGGINFESYIGAATPGTKVRGNSGVRLRIASPALRVGIGADYNATYRQTRPLFSLYSPVVRGGFFHNGSELRLDVLPGYYPQASVSIETPVRRRIPTGTTRPRIDHVQLSAAKAAPLRAPAIAAQLAEPLTDARAAAALIRRLNVPFLDETSSNRKHDEAAVIARIHDLRTALPPEGASVSAIETHVRRFHSDVERAFVIGLSGSIPDSGGARLPDAAAVAEKARAILLDEVLFPYDRLLGQARRHDTTEEFAKRARGAFMRWLVAETSLPREATDAAAWVFSAVLQIVEDNRAALRREWGDSRFVWLPLQYGLTPEQHDTQAELDSLTERAVGVRFTDGNSLSYVINEQFQYQLSRTIREAKDYHVLWIHDFRGVDARGDPDAMSYQHVLHSYMAALTQRVREYDRTGRMPAYIILIDEWFYQVNHGSLWLNLLEDPTRYELHLPKRNAAWEQAIRVAQDSLRQAIDGSQLLQAHRVQFGDAWLQNLVKVHVNVTNASDPSFWSWRVAKLIPLFDNLMRDHRKLVFYDVSEEDPYRGEALFTGAGIGEHYASLAWEDRALLVRGPALLGLKNAARGALLQQGMARHRIPWPLQPREMAPDYNARVALTVAQEQQPLRALTITNETGFDAKQINVAKGVLYTLMPTGSVIKIPDSLWNSAFWGSALVGCALRGVRVLVIGPALANAPANFFGSMIRSQELFWRLLTVARELRPEIQRAGGLLRVGVFFTTTPVTDIPGKVRAVNGAFAQHEWLRQLFDYPPSVYEGLAQLALELNGLPTSRPIQAEFEADSHPKLHLKANFFASREAWGLMSRPEWADITREFVQQRIAQLQTPSDSIRNFETFPPPFLDVGRVMVNDWFSQLSPETRDRVVFYTMMGSQNQNARSMVNDGEDAIVVSSWPSIIPYLDFLTLVGQSRWLDDPADLAALLPPQSGLKRRAAHWFKLVF